MINEDQLLWEYYEEILLNEFTEKTIRKLVDRFANPDEGVTEEMVRSYLERFKRVKAKLKQKDPFQYKSFHDLEVAVDAVDKKKGKESPKEGDKETKEDLIVYEDSKVVVYQAKKQRDAVRLGENEKYSFCISRRYSGNLFSSYRLRAHSTFYFVRFKGRSDEGTEKGFIDPKHYIVIDAQTSGRYQWTWADNGSQDDGQGTMDVEISEILNIFPELKPPFEQGIFQNIPLTEEERARDLKFQKMNSQYSQAEFENWSYEDKEDYIKNGYVIRDLNILDKNLRNEYIKHGHEISKADFRSLTDSEKKTWVNTRSEILLNWQEVVLFCRFLIREDYPINDIIDNDNVYFGERALEELLEELDDNADYAETILKILKKCYHRLYMGAIYKYLMHSYVFDTISSEFWKIFLKDTSPHRKSGFGESIFKFSIGNDITYLIPVKVYSEIFECSTRQDIIDLFVNRYNDFNDIPQHLLDALSENLKVNSYYPIGKGILHEYITRSHYYLKLEDLPEELFIFITNSPYNAASFINLYLKAYPSFFRIPKKAMETALSDSKVEDRLWSIFIGLRKGLENPRELTKHEKDQMFNNESGKIFIEYWIKSGTFKDLYELCRKYGISLTEEFYTAMGMYYGVDDLSSTPTFYEYFFNTDEK